MFYFSIPYVDVHDSCSKLNRKFHEAQKLIDNNNGGRRIASEGSKKYHFLPKEKEEDEKVIEENADWVNNEGHSFSKFDQQLTNSGYEDFADVQEEEDEDNMSYRKSRRLRKKKPYHLIKPLVSSSFLVEDSETDNEEEIESRGGGFLVDLSKEEPNQRNAVKSGGFFDLPQLKERESNRHAVVEVASDDGFEEVPLLPRSAPQDHVNPSIDENEEAEELDDVEWEAESISQEEEFSAFDEEGSSDVTHRLQPGNLDSGTVFPSKSTASSSFSQYQLQSSFSQFSSPPSDAISRSSTHISESVLDRAIITASSMADWAGRVVKRVLKEHIEKEKAENKEKEKVSLSHSLGISDPLTTPSFYSPSKPLPIDLTLNEDEEIVRDVITTHKSSVPSFLQPSPTTSAPIWSKISSKIETFDLLESQPEDTANTSPHSPLPLLENSNDVSSSSSTSVSQQQLTASPSKKKSGDFADVVSPITRNHTMIKDNDIEYDERFDEGYDDIETIRRRIAAASRDAERMTEEMKIEVIELIKAFDLPYIIAPFEAEAQCAILEQVSRSILLQSFL
jgi:hypothetical protein